MSERSLFVSTWTRDRADILSWVSALRDAGFKEDARQFSVSAVSCGDKHWMTGFIRCLGAGDEIGELESVDWPKGNGWYGEPAICIFQDCHEPMMFYPERKRQPKDEEIAALQERVEFLQASLEEQTIKASSSENVLARLPEDLRRKVVAVMYPESGESGGS